VFGQITVFYCNKFRYDHETTSSQQTRSAKESGQGFLNSGKSFGRHFGPEPIGVITIAVMIIVRIYLRKPVTSTASRRRMGSGRHIRKPCTSFDRMGPAVRPCTRPSTRSTWRRAATGRTGDRRQWESRKRSEQSAAEMAGQG